MKRSALFVILLVFPSLFLQAKNETVTVIKFFRNADKDVSEVALEKVGDHLRLNIPAKELADVTRVELQADFATAHIGDPGFFLTPDGMICNFTQKQDGEHKVRFYPLEMWGSSTPAGTYLAIIKGMRFELVIKESLKDGVFRQSQVFDLKNCGAYDDILIDWYPLKPKDATYSGMGRRYRQYQLERGEVKPVKERIKTNKWLDYAAQAPEIRIRMGWKPYPSPVMEQTLENEPEMHVATTFERVGDLVDALKKRGVGKAEICLVGWNVRGHDGRWPTAFPVEPALGGEEGLRKLISHAQESGYNIVCHTNASDCYTISPDLDTNDVAFSPKGKWKDQGKWSGGRMYQLCPKRSFERYSPQTHAKVRELGFRGLHYIDVISCGKPAVCYNPKHPLNREEALVYEKKILADAAEKIGGCQSEGPFDAYASVLDFVYKVFMPGSIPAKPSIIDGYVPVWNVVYNGIILNNAGGGTNNFAFRTPSAAIKIAELATRPTFYLYQNFRSDRKPGSNHTIDSDEDMCKTADAIAKAWNMMQELGYLQYEFLEDHSTIAESVTRSIFSDGSEVIANRSDKEFVYKKQVVAPGTYRLFKK